MTKPPLKTAPHIFNSGSDGMLIYIRDSANDQHVFVTAVWLDRTR